MKKNKFFYCALFLFPFVISQYETFAQCDTIVPVWVVDLSSNPDTIWDQKAEPRDGYCCSATGTDRCIKFIVTLHPSVGGIYFGARNPGPSGAMYFVFECDSAKTFIVNQDTACVNGPGPHNITICKPGGDDPIYTIAGIGKGEISGPITVSDACHDTLFAIGFNPSTITWTSVPNDSMYNTFLSCTSGCDTNIVSPYGAYPDSILYKVCGTPAGLECGGSGGGAKCDSVWVHFISTLSDSIFPVNPSICFGSPGVTLTANPSGGAPPYSYLWNTGETSGSIVAGAAGIFWVQVSDSTGCPGVFDTTFVFKFNQAITADAGPDDSVCSLSPGISLAGTVTGTTTCIWSGGTGTFFPGPTSLNTGYLPAGSEVAADSVTLTLITTNTGSCPPDSDDITIYFLPPPIADAGSDDSICENNPLANLSGSIVNSTGGNWTTTGNGSFSPDSSSLNAAYSAGSADISNGSVILILSAISSVCPSVSDSMTIFIGAVNVVVSAGNDQSVCADAAGIPLNGTVTSSNPLIGGGWSTSGTGTFSPDSATLNSTYVPSPADTITGSVILTLTSVNNGNCLALSDSLVITFLPTVAVNAGQDTVICNDVDSILLSGFYSNAAGVVWSTSGAGIFTPSDSMVNPVYVIAPADKYFGKFTLVISTLGGCSGASDTIEITVIPSVYAGIDQIICLNDTDVTLNGTVSGALGTTWATTGSGYFLPDDSTLNATYIIGTVDSASGNVNIILTTYGGFGGCPNAIDTLRVTILPPTTVDAGVNQNICADSAFIQLNGVITNAPAGYWSSSGSGIFSPDSSLLNAIYILSSGDTALDSITVTLNSAGGCISAYDSMFVFVEHLPVSYAGSNFSVCATNPIVALNGAVVNATGGTWSASGTGTFNPNDTTLAGVFYNPSASDINAGGVFITLTTSGSLFCQANTDTLFITYTPDSINVNAGADLTLCQNDSAILLNGTVAIAQGGIWGGTGSGTFFPSDTLPVTAYIPSASDKAGGTVQLWLTTTGNGGCLPRSDTLLLTINDSIGVSVWAANDTICPSVINVQLFVTFLNLSKGIWATSGDGIFTPNDSTPNAIYQPGASDISSGSATLQFTSADNGNCAPVSDSLYIIILPGPFAAFYSADVCAGDSSFLTDSSFTNITVWLWDFGDSSAKDTNPDPVHLFPGWGNYNVQLVVTSSNGCTDTAIKPLLIHPPPAAAFAGPVPCFSDTAVFNDLSSVPIDSIVSWSWFFGDGDSSALQNPSHGYSPGGLYSVVHVVTSDFGCSDTAIASFSTTPVADYSFTEECQSDYSVFSDSSTADAVKWEWNFNDGSPVDTTENPAHLFNTWGSINVQLVVVSSNGCTDTMVKAALIHPLPVASFVSTAQCFVDSAIFIDNSAIPMDSVISWFWDFGDGDTSGVKNPIHLYPAGGSYTVVHIVQSDFGCSDTVAQTLNVSPAPAAGFNYSSANGGCPPDIFLFADASTVDTSFSSIKLTGWQWNFGDGSPPDTAQNPPPHTYGLSGMYPVTLIIKADNGCYDTLTQDIIIHPLPVAGFYFNPELCVNDTALFTDSSSVTPPYTIASLTWYFGDGTSAGSQSTSHQYPSYGNYPVTLIVQTDSGCADTLTNIIYVRPVPIARFSISNQIIYVDETVSMTDLSAGSSIIPDSVAIFQWLWDFGDNNSSSQQYPTYTYDSGGVFTISLIVENQYGCRDTANDSIIVRLPPLVPLGFSPNGDGQNDILFVEGGPYKQLDFTIYNEWGEKIFISNKQEEGWNGTRENKNQPMGVYVWVLRAVTEDDRDYEMWGEVTLLR